MDGISKSSHTTRDLQHNNNKMKRGVIPSIRLAPILRMPARPRRHTAWKTGISSRDARRRGAKREQRRVSLSRIANQNSIVVMGHLHPSSHVTPDPLRRKIINRTLMLLSYQCAAVVRKDIPQRRLLCLTIFGAAHSGLFVR